MDCNSNSSSLSSPCQCGSSSSSILGVVGSCSSKITQQQQQVQQQQQQVQHHHQHHHQEEHSMSPKSPPGSFDLYGKRRQIIKLQSLEREIGLLQEEVKFVQTLQPSSRCCKELDDFIGANPDPLIATTNLEIQQSSGFLKRLRGRFSVNKRWIWCLGNWWLHLERRNCCKWWYCCPNLGLTGCGCFAKLTCSRCCKSSEDSGPAECRSSMKGNLCLHYCCCY
ncbi:hypothetical protein ACFE04_003834 [Oxalis oulophora]